VNPITRDRSLAMMKDRRRRPEGVNESQLKFLEGTRPMSQNQPDMYLLYIGQDRVVIEEISALKTRL
jgi:hypothetical protein